MDLVEIVNEDCQQINVAFGGVVATSDRPEKSNCEVVGISFDRREATPHGRCQSIRKSQLRAISSYKQGFEGRPQDVFAICRIKHMWASDNF